MRLGDFKEMQLQNELAIEADKDFVPAFEALGDAFMAQGKQIRGRRRKD
jgi:hypothetical protein